MAERNPIHWLARSGVTVGYRCLLCISIGIAFCPVQGCRKSGAGLEVAHWVHLPGKAAWDNQEPGTNWVISAPVLLSLIQCSYNWFVVHGSALGVIMKERRGYSIYSVTSPANICHCPLSYRNRLPNVSTAGLEIQGIAIMECRAC